MKTVAIIGCGKATDGKEGWAIGHAHANGYLASGHDVKLIGVDLSAENLQAFGDAFDVPADQLFGSTDALYAALTPDCVSICTWPALHHPMAMEAMDRGVKAIACEKPLTLNVGELRELEAKAEATNTVFVVAHQRCYNPVHQTLRDIAASDALGDRLRVEAHVGDGWDILSWTTHWFEMANFIFCSAPEWVLAGMDIHETRRYQQAVEDASVVYAQYPGDRSGVFVTGPGGSASCRLTGSRGMAIADGSSVYLCTRDGVKEIACLDSDYPGDFAALLGDMLAALQGGAEPLCALRRTAMATEMAYAAHESARTAKKVALPFTGEYAPLEVAQHPVTSATRGLRTLLYADHHFGSGGREGLAEALKAVTGQAVKVIDAEAQGLTTADLQQIDAIVIYHTQAEADDATRLALSEWVHSGKPLLVAHAGLGAWPEWNDFTTWAGKVWDWGVSSHPHETVILTPTEGDPLAFGWELAWLPKDECFIDLKQTAPTINCLTATISSGDYAAAWQHAEWTNVGGWMPGHRRDLWAVPAMREGLTHMLQKLRQATAEPALL